MAGNRSVVGGAYSGPRSEPGGRNTPKAGRSVAAYGSYITAVGSFWQQVDQGYVPDLSGPYAPVVMADSPVAYWRLADLNDSSGNGFELTPGGTVPATASLLPTDTANGSREFKTAAMVDLLAHDDDPRLRLSSAFSVEAWFVTDFMPENWCVLGKINHYRIETTTGNKIRATVWSTSPGSFWPIDSTTTVVVGNLYHVVLTFDGTTERLYVNGVLENSTAIPPSLPTDNTARFAIGHEPDGANLGFWGRVDEVAVYQSVMSGTRVLAHYNAGVGAPPVVYTDSGTATVTASGTATEAASAADSGSATATASGSGTETFSHSASGTATATASGSGTEVFQPPVVYTDSGSATATAAGTAAESASAADIGTATVTASGSGTELYQPPVVYTDSGSATVTASGSGTESWGLIYADSASGTASAAGTATESQSQSTSGSVTITASGAGTESNAYTDSASGTATASGTSIEGLSQADSASGSMSVAGTRSDSYEYTDARAGSITCSGTAVEASAGNDSATGMAAFSGDGSEAATFTESASGTVNSSGSGVENYAPSIVYTDTAVGTSNVTGSGVENYTIAYIDQGSGGGTLDGSGSDDYIADDLETVLAQFDGSGFDEAAYFDQSSGSVAATGTGSVRSSISYQLISEARALSDITTSHKRMTNIATETEAMADFRMLASAR